MSSPAPITNVAKLWRNVWHAAAFGIDASFTAFAKSVELISQEMEQLADAESWPERKLKIKTCFDVLDRVKVHPDAPQLNIHQHLHAHVEKMSDNELFRDVMDLTKEGQD